MRRRKTYAEGDDVIVYDNRTKVSSKGKIVEVLGNNTYLADCGFGSKHVSGDVLSKASSEGLSSGNVASAATDRIREEDMVNQDFDEEDRVDEDNESTCSESSIGSSINMEYIDPPLNNENVVRNRRMVSMLGRPQTMASRLRPRERR